MSNQSTELVRATLKKRYFKEKLFRGFGIAAIVASLGFLAILLGSIFIKGYPAFKATYLNIDVSCLNRHRRRFSFSKFFWRDKVSHVRALPRGLVS